MQDYGSNYMVLLLVPYAGQQAQKGQTVLAYAYSIEASRRSTATRDSKCTTCQQTWRTTVIEYHKSVDTACKHVHSVQVHQTGS